MKNPLPIFMVAAMLLSACTIQPLNMGGGSSSQSSAEASAKSESSSKSESKSEASVKSDNKQTSESSQSSSNTAGQNSLTESTQGTNTQPIIIVCNQLNNGATYGTSCMTPKQISEMVEEQKQIREITPRISNPQPPKKK